MKFGLFINPEHAADDDLGRRFEEHLDQVRLARDLGFDSIHIGHHPSRGPSIWFPPLLALARFAAESGELRLGPSVFLLPQYHPVQVAEDVAMMDLLTGGRFIFGAAAAWREDEFTALGLNVKERVGRTRESLEIIQRLWTEESVTFEGKYFQLKDVSLTLKPVQKPRPPIWMGASGPAAIKRAARLADTWVTSAHISLDTLAEHSKIYEEELRALGKPLPADRPSLRNTFVAEDRETALRDAAPIMAASYKLMGDWGLFEQVVGSGKKHLDLDELLEGRLVAGTPQDCIQQLERYVERVGRNYFIFRVQLMGFEQAKVLRTIRLLGTEVIPYLRRKYPS